MTFTAGTFSNHGAQPGVVRAGEVKTLSPYQRAWMAGLDFSAGGSRITSPLDQSAWILSCCRWLASPLASVPFRWWDSADDTTRKPLAADGRRADFWASPGEGDFGREDFDNVTGALVAWLAMDGEAYIVLPDEWLAARSRAYFPGFIAAGRRELTPQFSGRSAGLSRTLVGWTFNAPGVSEVLLPEQVIRIAVSHPGNRERGLGALRAASVAADADYAAGVYAGNVARSNGASGDYIVTDGGLPNPEQQEQITAALREKKRRTEAGDYSPTFLAGGLKVQSPADRAIGSALLSQRLSNREEIAAAFCVPLSLLQSVTGSSLGEGRVDSEIRALIEHGTAPLATRIARAYSVVEQRRTRSQAVAEFALGEHRAMASARLGASQTAKTFVDMGVPLEEVNRVFGLGFNLTTEPPEPEPAELPDETLLALEGARKEFSRFIEAKALTAPTPAAPAAPAPAKQELFIVVKAEGNTNNAAASGQRPAEPVTAKRTDGSPDAPLNNAGTALQMGARKPRDKARVQKWERYQKVRKPFEDRFKKAIATLFKSAQTEALATLEAELPAAEDPLDGVMPAKALVAAKLDKGLAVKATEKALSFAVIKFDLFQSAFASTLMPIVLDAYAAGSDEVAEEIRALGIDPKTPREVPAALAQRKNLIKDAAESTFRKLTESLNNGYDAGETMGELAGRVKTVFRDATDAQAVTIATTETHTAFNIARQAQHEAAGIEWKEWLSAGDAKVRATHLEVDGIVMPSDKPFALPGGVELMHPCAEGGPAEEVINCRCIAIAVGATEGAARYAEQTPKEN